ncbi:MAG: hypothetical protein ABI995_14370, partial [Acidobacteriota bacterium]
MVELQYGDKDLTIFDKYLMYVGNAEMGRLGRELHLTPQGVSFLKQRLLRALRGAIFDDRYKGMRFRFSEAFVAPLRLLKQEMAAKIAFDFVEAKTLFQTATGSDLSANEPGRGLMLEILGYAVHSPFGEASAPVVLRTSQNGSTVARAVRYVQRLLTSQFPKGLTRAEIFARLRSVGHTRQTVSTVAAILGLFPDIEFLNDGWVRAPINKLTRTLDQIERILLEGRRPMSSRDLS